ncbi:MAG: hypothetical protein JKY49_00965 [Cohaesibacteraceae bacterium]|nr:hypothetical protein [Cohaesibacteraceae bacterium]MBL4876519.1 hypothetical protein [Cohaesibacteraceae bacterium]
METEPFNFDTPILFLIFRQPEITRRVFEQIRIARPKKLFISADGPRSEFPNDIKECEETRAVVSKIDWECEVKTRYLPKNVGLKNAVSSAIEWFFDHVEEGIILEYDCLPDPSFFKYCQTMLERYRHDTRIYSVSGNNIQADIRRGDGDYYYSRITGIWGWATWKRSWKTWRPNLEDYDKFRSHSVIRSIISDKTAQNFWIKSFDQVHNGFNTSTWAFCLIYAQFIQGSYCIVPNQNLIKNIGFGPNATNAGDPKHPLANLSVTSINNYRSPSFFVPDLEADNESSVRAAYQRPNPWYVRIPRRLIVRILELTNLKSFVKDSMRR